MARLRRIPRIDSIVEWIAKSEHCRILESVVSLIQLENEKFKRLLATRMGRVEPKEKGTSPEDPRRTFGGTCSGFFDYKKVVECDEFENRRKKQPRSEEEIRGGAQDERKKSAGVSLPRESLPENVEDKRIVQFEHFDRFV